jgi:membrane-associated phospholipid phosphatase
MPWAGAPAAAPTFLEALVPLYHAGLGTASSAFATLTTLPAQVVVSFLIVAAAGLRLRRAGRVEAAAGWLAAWAAGTALEVVCKHALVRPALVRDGVHAVAYDASWPSGHTLRAAIVAGALAAAWPRARPWLAIWLATAVALLVAAGFHTPTDVAGGLLLAALLALGVRELERSGLLPRRAALRAGGAGAALRRRA